MPLTYNDERTVPIKTMILFPVNVPLIVVVDNVVSPDTLNDDIHVVTPFNIVIPLTFNDAIHVVTPFNCDVPLTFIDDIHVVTPFNLMFR